MCQGGRDSNRWWLCRWKFVGETKKMFELIEPPPRTRRCGFCLTSKTVIQNQTRSNHVKIKSSKRGPKAESEHFVFGVHYNCPRQWYIFVKFDKNDMFGHGKNVCHHCILYSFHRRRSSPWWLCCNHIPEGDIVDSGTHVTRSHWRATERSMK